MSLQDDIFEVVAALESTKQTVGAIENFDRLRAHWDEVEEYAERMAADVRVVNAFVDLVARKTNPPNSPKVRA